MLSRVANLAYWMGRHLERAENTGRIIDVNTQLVLDLQSRQEADAPQAWEPLVYVSGNEEDFRRLYEGGIGEQAVVEFMLFDRRNPSSIQSCISQARENARCMRDQLATEMWEQINTFYLKLVKDTYRTYTREGSGEYIRGIKTQIQLIYGIAESMLPRNQVWWFFELGRHLERADNTPRIIDVKYYTLLPSTHQVGSALDVVQWAAVLRTCSGFEAFRKSRRGQLTIDRVVDYLLREDTFPRSVLHAVRTARLALDCITADAPYLADNAARQRVQELEHELESIEVSEIIASGLHEFLEQIQVKVAGIHAAVQNTFIHYPTQGARIVA